MEEIMDFGCSCICGDFDFDGDSASVCETKMRTARKDHICCECSEKIEKGKKYEHSRGLWEGGWETYKTCEVCVRIRNDVYCGRFIYGELREEIWEAYGIDYVTGEILEKKPFTFGLK
jgi:hypothetical protein